MLRNIIFWMLIFVVSYEILPELLCRLSGGRLDHFAGVVQCNSTVESVTLILTIAILLILYVKIKTNEKTIIHNRSKQKPSKILRLVAILSTTITLISAMMLWMKTGFSLVPDDSARGVLVILYHSVFGNPLIAPFLYLSIITSTYLYIIYNRRTLWLISILSITLGCYVTMSRGFILSAILPFIIFQPVGKLIKFTPMLLILFFLRDILNGNIVSYFSESANPIQIYVNAFGEFTNTYFGRRYAIDNGILGNYEAYLLENSVKVTGIYYVFAPIFKLLAAHELNLPSATLELNNSIEQSLGLTGFAGSYLTDMVIFFPLPLIFICVTLIILAQVNKHLNNNEKLILTLTAAMLLPNAFRWSLSNYVSLLAGVTIAYIVLKVVLTKANVRPKLNNPRQL